MLAVVLILVVVNGYLFYINFVKNSGKGDNVNKNIETSGVSGNIEKNKEGEQIVSGEIVCLVKGQQYQMSEITLESDKTRCFCGVYGIEVCEEK